MSGSEYTLFSDTFKIDSINSQKYDRVSRISGTTSDSATTLTLDVNVELFPVYEEEALQIVLASSLNLGAQEDPSGGGVEGKGWRQNQGPSLADAYDYVCHGKIYRFEEGSQGETM
jgi:DNA-directed RNA polymerases I, II, and III subunit RPABC3